jgi:hypothetical protein
VSTQLQLKLNNDDDDNNNNNNNNNNSRLERRAESGDS